jgi:hypothetical protein
VQRLLQALSGSGAARLAAAGVFGGVLLAAAARTQRARRG